MYLLLTNSCLNFLIGLGSSCMMPASVMAPVLTRSSLELMLDAIRLRDEQPRDLPPALPARPTSRARLPSSMRSLPLCLKISSSLPECLEEREVEKENRPPKDAVVKKEIFRSKRCEKLDQVEEITCVKMPELESYEDCREETNGLEFPAIVPTSYKSLDPKAATWGDVSNKTLQGILSVQKHFRGVQARLCYQELKQGVIALQSFVRGERSRHQYSLLIKRLRATVLIQKHARRWIAWKRFHDHQKNIIHLQSVIRGWLARKHILDMKNVDISKKNQVKVNGVNSNYQKIKDSDMEHPQLHHSVLVELQIRVLKTVAALREKEEENVQLRKQLKHYEMRWSNYEAKMKSMEEMWQRQITSLQMNLATAKKSLAADVMSQTRKPDTSPIGHYHDSEGFLSAETRTPEGMSHQQVHASSARTSDGTLTAVSLLVNEFEKHKKVFEDDTGFLMEAKCGQSDLCIKPAEELRKLKSRFSAWKKDFKVRLRETKAALKKLGSLEPKKTCKRWWGNKRTTKT